MIDPDAIVIDRVPRKNSIDMGEIPECDFYPYDLDDDKGLKVYISDIEKEVRGSFEYRQFIYYIRNFMGMDTCSYISTVSNKESKTIKVEIHHYPFSLYDICEIVYKKRSYYSESLELEMVAKEVMQLHYNAMVGLIPLSETVHKLFHNGKLFIPVTNVFGRYDLFMVYYDIFITEDQKDTINRIEKYSTEQKSELLNTTILDTNNLYLNQKSPEYQLPPMNGMGSLLSDQISKIKQNSYNLPTAHEKLLEDTKEDRRPIECPIYFINEKGEKINE